MKHPINYKLEFLFLLLGACLAGFLVLPIVHARIDFPFIWYNVIFSFAAVILFKHVFLLHHTWLNHFQKLKIALIPLSVPIIFTFIRMLNGFTTHIDEVAIADSFAHLPIERRQFFTAYIKTEYIAVAVTAIAGAILFPFRLLINIWREVNNKGR